MILKDGSITKDPRLDRLIEFDERSLAFPIRAKLPTYKPRGRTWNFRKYDPKLDQGPDGACVGFTIGNDLACSPAMTLGIDNTFAKENIYWEAQKIDPWDGGSYPGADPHNEGTSVLSGVKIAQKLGYIKEYRWAFNIDDVIQTLGYFGPVLLGVNWYEGMMETDEKGFIHPTGNVSGGHAILARGVNIKQDYILLRQSWGTGWSNIGEGLDCKIKIGDLEYLLKQNGECCVPVKRKV